MFDFIKTKVADLTDMLGHPISLPKPVEPLHAYDDPDIWLKEPAYNAPADVDIVQEQKWIDSLMGTTRDNQSIYKLVWNGDRNFWYQFFLGPWNSLGKPMAPVVRRPRIRYKVLRDPITRAIQQDVFPPRWVILTRLEPEQFPNYKQESYSWAPEINGYKQIRPDEPPDVFWLWYATIARHTDYCCATAQKNQKHCYGKYVAPGYAREMLQMQRQADLAAGVRSVYQQVDSSFADEIADQYTGYTYEMEQLKVEAEVFIENPMALLGVEASLRAGVNAKEARQMVKEFYDREAQEQSKLLSK